MEFNYRKENLLHFLGVSERPFTLEEELKNREEEIRLLKDKLSQTNLKLYESKNNCTLLRQDINKAQKVSEKV